MSGPGEELEHLVSELRTVVGTWQTMCRFGAELATRLDEVVQQAMVFAEAWRGSTEVEKCDPDMLALIRRLPTMLSLVSRVIRTIPSSVLPVDAATRETARALLADLPSERITFTLEERDFLDQLEAEMDAEHGV